LGYFEKCFTVSKSSTSLLNSNISSLTNNNVEILANESLLDQFKSLNLNGDITHSEYYEMQKLIIENQEQLKSKNSELKSKIL
jgi:hypothetical protein